MRGRHRRLYRAGGLVVWLAHIALSRLGFYRCPRCKGRLNYRWWCKACGRYRLPAR